MARIIATGIERHEKALKRQEPTVCTYSVDVVDKVKYVQFDTYGSSARKLKDKVSQVLQLDREAASEMVRILIEEFGPSITGAR